MKKIIVFLISLIFLLSSCVINRSSAPEDYTGETIQDDEFISFGDFKLYVFKLPYGRAQMAYLPTGETILIDCGAGEDFSYLYEKLRKLEVNVIDSVILTSLDSNYAGGAGKIIENFEVCEVYVNESSKDSEEYEYIKSTAESNNVAVRLASEGTRIYDFDKVCVDVVSSDAKSPLSQFPSLSLYIVCGGKSIFVEGEGSIEDEAKMATELKGSIKTDILITPMSENKETISMYFLKELSPKYTVICLKYDKYPPEKLTSVIKETVDTEILRTDINGDICFSSNGIDISLKTEG